MDPICKPYSPDAGSPPPDMAGRDALRQKMIVCIERLRRGKPSKGMILIGLKGTGKSVLLDQMMKDAGTSGALTMRLEAREGRSLPAVLTPQLRIGLLKLSRTDKSKDAAILALRALAGFVDKMKVTFNDIEVELDYEPEPGLADNGDLEGDLTMLLTQVGKAAQAGVTPVAIFIDDFQHVPEPQTAALICALHRCTQLQLPLIIVGAGLPQLRARMGQAKSYAKRLFDFPEIGPLNSPC